MYLYMHMCRAFMEHVTLHGTCDHFDLEAYIMSMYMYSLLFITGFDWQIFRKEIHLPCHFLITLPFSALSQGISLSFISLVISSSLYI